MPATVRSNPPARPQRPLVHGPFGALEAYLGRIHARGLEPRGALPRGEGAVGYEIGAKAQAPRVVNEVLEIGSKQRFTAV